MFKIFVCSFVLLLFVASAATQSTSTIRTDGWQTASADSVGLDSKKLANLTQSMRSWPELGVHAILIERNGLLVYEQYFDGFDEKWGQPLGRVTMNRQHPRPQNPARTRDPGCKNRRSRGLSGCLNDA